MEPTHKESWNCNLCSNAANAVAIVETTGIMQVLIYEDIHLTTAHPGVSYNTESSALFRFAIVNAQDGSPEPRNMKHQTLSELLCWTKGTRTPPPMYRHKSRIVTKVCGLNNLCEYQALVVTLQSHSQEWTREKEGVSVCVYISYLGLHSCMSFELQCGLVLQIPVGRSSRACLELGLISTPISEYIHAKILVW